MKQLRSKQFLLVLSALAAGALGFAGLAPVSVVHVMSD